MERKTVGTGEGSSAVVPPPPAGFDFTENPKLAKSIPPPPPGFEFTAPPPADPLARKITRAEDLPSMEEFDASHTAAGNAITQALQPKPTLSAAPPLTWMDRIKQAVVGGVDVGDTPVGRALGFDFEGQYDPHQQTADLPLLRPTALAPKDPTTVAGGVAKGAASVAEGLTTAPNVLMLAGSSGLGLLGKVSSLLPKAVSAGFSLQMFRDLANQVPEVAEAVKSGDPAKIAERVTEAAATATFATLAAKHAKGKPKTAKEVVESIKPPKEDPFIRDEHGNPLMKKGTEAPETDFRAQDAKAIPDPPAGFDLNEPPQSVPRGTLKEQVVENEDKPFTNPLTGEPTKIGPNSPLGKERARQAAETRQDAPPVGEGPTTQTKPEAAAAITEPAKPAPSGESVRPPKTPPVAGRETSVAIPGEDTPYPARYVVREMADVQSSHSGLNFEPNPAYEPINDRDYKSNTHLQTGVIERAGAKFDPNFTTSDAPTAEHGPSIIDARGNVLGGNSRIQSMQRVDKMNPEGRKKYNEALQSKAAAFGLDPASIGKMKEPVLLRELTGKHDAQRAITDFNKGAPAKLAPEEQAVADGRRLSPKTVSDIAARMGDLGESGTMAEALRGDGGAQVLNLLEKDGVITAQEKGGLVDERDQLTPEMKSRIGKALVGRLFSTPAEFKNTPPAMRAKLERVAPQVLRVEGRPEWNITETIREAATLLEDARAHKSKVADTASQARMGEAKRYSPEAIRIAEVMEENPRNVEYAFRRYANDEALSRDGSQKSMFPAPSRQQAFADAFGDLPPAVEVTPEHQPMVALEDKIEAIRKRAIKDRVANPRKSSFAYRAKQLASDEAGAVTLPDMKKIREAYEESPVKAVVGTYKLAKSLGQRIKDEGGGAGRVLMRMYETQRDRGELEADRLTYRIGQSKPSRLSEDELFEVHDALHGFGPEPTAPHVREVFDAFREANDEVGLIATGLGVEVKTKNGYRPFAAMKNYMQHRMASADELKSGPIRDQMIKNIVRQKWAPDVESATRMVDDQHAFLKSGKRSEALLKALVKMNPGRSEAEIWADMQQSRSNIEKHGSLEFAREVNSPFYDPNPARVIPFSVATAAKRLSQIAEFGQDHRVINEEILKISRAVEQAGGNAKHSAEFVRRSIDRMIGATREDADDLAVIASRVLRAASSLKVLTASLRNAPQGIVNSLPASDLPAVVVGLGRSLTKRGGRFNAANTALDEIAQDMGGGKLIQRYMTANGMRHTERANFRVASNIGEAWAERLVKKAQGSGKGAQQAKDQLKDLGIDPETKALSEEDVLKAAKVFSNATQFRNRPEDLPDFATSGPLGKAVFQFKNFAYQQARFAAKQTIGEWKAGRPGRATRNAIILGLVYPYTFGAFYQALFNGINGKHKEMESGVEDYFDKLAQSSTLGVWLDSINAAEQNRIPEFAAGPAVGQVKDLAKMLTTLADDDKTAAQKEKAIKHYGLSRFGSAPEKLLEKIKK